MDPTGPRRLSVLMPVYNEARTLHTIVRRVLASPVDMELELVCVDDASTDRSRSILEELARDDRRIRVFGHPVNRGKGAALRTAIEQMTGEVAIIQDSDLEYDPADYPRLLKPILEGRADAVFGSRFAASPERRVLLFWHSVGNKALTGLTNLLNDINLTDMETGYKAVRADILRRLRLQSERFGIEPEMTTRLVQWGARLYEVPISYHGRSYVEGKNIGWRDGVQAVWLLLKYRFFDRRFTTHEGFYILRSVRKARRYNRWVFGLIEPFVGRRVVEAGCGIGNFTELLLDRSRLVCVDVDPVYVEAIHHRYGHLDNVRVLAADLTDPVVSDTLAAESPDTVICLNVLEHVEDGHKLLSNLGDALAEGGRLLVQVPAGPRLYSRVDRTLGHVRRYTEERLRQELEGAEFEVLALQSFNRLGGMGWWVSGHTGRTRVSPWQSWLFNLLVPLAKLADRLRIGPPLSMIAVARRRPT